MTDRLCSHCRKEPALFGNLCRSCRLEWAPDPCSYCKQDPALLDGLCHACYHELERRRKEATR